MTFLERTDRGGNPSEAPPEYVAIQVPDGVVLDKTFVERTKPAAARQGRLDEDDSFLSIATETWDYDVVAERQDEFVAAVRNSRMAVECLRLDDEPTTGRNPFHE